MMESVFWWRKPEYPEEIIMSYYDVGAEGNLILAQTVFLCAAERLIRKSRVTNLI